jgi:hypothetical protein
MLRALRLVGKTDEQHACTVIEYTSFPVDIIRTFFAIHLFKAPRATEGRALSASIQTRISCSSP